MSTLLTFTEDFVKPEFERVEGVGSMMIFAGREQEMQVVVDPAKLAARRITITAATAKPRPKARTTTRGTVVDDRVPASTQPLSPSVHDSTNRSTGF